MSKTKDRTTCAVIGAGLGGAEGATADARYCAACRSTRQ